MQCEQLAPSFKENTSLVEFRLVNPWEGEGDYPRQFPREFYMAIPNSIEIFNVFVRHFLLLLNCEILMLISRRTDLFPRAEMCWHCAIGTKLSLPFAKSISMFVFPLFLLFFTTKAIYRLKETLLSWNC